MTVNYKLDSMLELRKYLWAKLKAAEIFNEDDYWSDVVGENIVPIIPVQQVPEMNQFLSGRDHIIYDKIGVSYDTLWLICNEQILFTLYSTDISKINEFKNFMIDEFRRMDESAKDVNIFPGFDSAHFKFHSIYVDDISPTEPSEELQGFYSTDVILEVKYSRTTNSSGRYI